ncbi:MAG: hypothetical protein U0491_02730 [Candidatus Saccharimonadales bacterium]
MKNTLVFGVFLIIGIATAASITAFFASKYVNGKENLADTCNTAKNVQNHVIVIENNVVTPTQSTIAYCDTLTIINKDSNIRLMAFGQHDKHVHYDGVEEKELSQGQSFTVTAVSKGTFTFHDHEQDEVQGEFTVN